LEAAAEAEQASEQGKEKKKRRMSIMGTFGCELKKSHTVPLLSSAPILSPITLCHTRRYGSGNGGYDESNARRENGIYQCR
jgi:hypothetical protein